MVSEITLHDRVLAATIHALAQRAYVVEANRIGCADFPPLRETVEELQSSSDRFLIFSEANKPVAVLSFVCEGNAIAINRLCVCPAHFRQGIARKLLARVEELIPTGSSLAVSTAEANVPAAKLYRDFGYSLTGTSRSRESIALAHFKKLKS
jgi:ribosomal protein S18 acetylase RimI-like enzyme